MAIVMPLLVSLLVAAAVVSIGFLIAYAYKRRYDFIDIVWGLLFIAIAWASVGIYAPHNGTAIGMAFLVTVWGLRLASHIFSRWRKVPGEDRRYIELRARWPQVAIPLQVFGRVYLLQAVLATIVSLPVILFIYAEPTFDEFILAGIVIWTAGVALEATADRQLRAFLSKQQNRGTLMSQGVWRYSRHPNYFGEILTWWGIGIMGLGQAYGLIGLIGPLVITLLLVFISGVPLAEKAMANKPGWKEYKARTSVLIPWPPR